MDESDQTTQFAFKFTQVIGVTNDVVVQMFEHLNNIYIASYRTQMIFSISTAFKYYLAL